MTAISSRKSSVLPRVPQKRQTPLWRQLAGKLHELGRRLGHVLVCVFHQLANRPLAALLLPSARVQGMLRPAEGDWRRGESEVHQIIGQLLVAASEGLEQLAHAQRPVVAGLAAFVDDFLMELQSAGAMICRSRSLSGVPGMRLLTTKSWTKDSGRSSPPILHVNRPKMSRSSNLQHRQEPTRFSTNRAIVATLSERRCRHADKAQILGNLLALAAT